MLSAGHSPYGTGVIRRENLSFLLTTQLSEIAKISETCSKSRNRIKCFCTLQHSYGKLLLVICGAFAHVMLPTKNKGDS